MKSILVFVQGTIGDTIVSIPALRAIRSRFGRGAKISLLHETHGHLSFNPQSVLNGLGLIDEFITYEFSYSYWRHRLAIAKLAVTLSIRRFDEMFYLIAADREMGQVSRDKRFFRVCGVRKVHGFGVLASDAVRPRRANGGLARVEHESRIRLKLLQSAGIAVDELLLRPPLFRSPASASHEAENWLRVNRVDPSRVRLVAIAPGAKKRSCMWPLENFAAVGRSVVNGYTMMPVVIGGSAERDAGVALTEYWGTGVNAAGQLSVLGTGALLERTSLLVGLDTGTTHLAAALGVPCVALYSAQDWPGRWEPLGDSHIVLRRDVACAGCRLTSCNVDGHPCMSGISVDEVLEAVALRLRDVQ